MSDFTTYTDDELDAKLRRIFAEHVGEDRPIERWTLVIEVYGAGADLPRSDDNVQDRMVRDAVQRLRSHGFFILDMSDGRGRFLAKSKQEYKKFRRRYLKPVNARWKVIHEMDKAAVLEWSDFFQKDMFDEELDAMPADLEMAV
jgi:hypothetical protein